MSSTEKPVSWVEAASILAANPFAVVACPSKQDGILAVFDIEHGEHVSRYLVCPKCQAHNVILIKITADILRPRLTLSASDENNYSLDEIIRLATESN
jgi:hypothetical protein